MPLAGAKRIRAIQISLFNHIEESLTDLDWMGPSPSRKPIILVDEPVAPNVEITPNTIALSFEDMDSSDGELGSNLSLDEWEAFIDIYAENGALGVALAAEVAGILRGKFPSLGIGEPAFEVINPQDPSDKFVCQISGVVVERSRDWDRAFNRYWWTVGFLIHDDHYDDSK